MSIGIESIVNQIVLSPSAFGPNEIAQITSAIAKSYGNYRELRDSAGFGALVAASRLPDALDNLRASQRAAVAVYARLPELTRALFTLAAIDPDAVAAVAAIEDGRRPGMRRLAEALDAQGYLRPGVSVDEAVDLLTVITSFQSFDELFAGSGLPPETVAERLIALAERSVCRPDLPAG